MTASPILAKRLPPQQRQIASGGTAIRSRARCAGSGRRMGRCRDMRRHDHARFRLGGFARRLLLGRGLLEFGQLRLELIRSTVYVTLAAL